MAGNDELYEHLKGMAAYTIRPSERMNELAVNFEVSRTPLRQSLNRLVAENLLNCVPHQASSSGSCIVKTSSTS